MALITTPTFTETVLFGPDMLIRGSSPVRVTADLRAAYGGVVLIAIGRSDAVALGSPVAVRVNRLVSIASGSLKPYNAGGPFTVEHPAPVVGGALVSQTAAAVTTTVNGDSAATGILLNVTSSAGFAAGDIISVDGAGDYTRWEICRVMKVSAGVLQLDSPLQFTHTAGQADVVTNKVDAFQVPVDGGAVIEAIVDYGAAASGSFVDVVVFLQKYGNDSTQ